MGKRKRNPENGEEGEKEKKKVKTRRRTQRVVSRFFQDGATDHQSQCRFNGSRPERRRKRSSANDERVVSRFFLKPDPEEVRLKPRRRSGTGRRSHGNHVVVDVDVSEIARRIEDPLPVTPEKRIEDSDAKEERVVSRFFQTGGPGVVAKLAPCSGRRDQAPTGRVIADIDEMLSRFAYHGGSHASPPQEKNLSLSPCPRIRSEKSDRRNPVRPQEQIEGADAEASPVKKVKEEKAKKEKILKCLSEAEKKKEAYRRKDVENPWKPPRSVHRLLQEDHAHDPWRVLVICMLLNQTTGKQTGQVLEALFSEFPDAKAAADGPEERIEEIIKTLGLQKKRSRMIKRMSQEYLSDGWTHVTQLHGVGKYAADAYAIFCTGRWKDVSPVDHKLKDYWDYLWDNEDGSR